MANLVALRFVRLGPLTRHATRCLLRRPVESCVFVTKNNIFSGPPDDPKPPPFPYKDRSYANGWFWFDATAKRIDDNSRLIVIEGNVAAGKTKFAQRLAKELNFHFVPDFDTEEFHYCAFSGCDLREINEQLPPRLHSYCLKNYVMDPDPTKYKQIGMLQMKLIEERWMVHNHALEHIWSTGQGVVMPRSVHSEIVFYNTMHKFGHFSKPALDHFNMFRDQVIKTETLKPHLVIYLDAPISYVKDEIKKRNLPHEVNSPWLGDEWFKSIEHEYKNTYLPYIEDFAEVLTYNPAEKLDWDAIIDDIEALNLDTAPEDDKKKFSDWLEIDDTTKMREARITCANKQQLRVKFSSTPEPWDAPECFISLNDDAILYKVMKSNPDLFYDKGWNPLKNNVLFRWASPIDVSTKRDSYFLKT